MVWNTRETGEIDSKSIVWDSSCSIDWKLELASSRPNYKQHGIYMTHNNVSLLLLNKLKYWMSTWIGHSLQIKY